MLAAGVLLAGARDASLGPAFDTTISHVEPGLENALFPSLTIDAAGNPVVSYAFSHSPTRLRVVHCNDAECLGGDESVAEPDATNDAGFFSSVQLDGAGNPVVSYVSAVTGGLNVVHCNDPDCADNDESIVTLDPAVYIGSTSLALDASGNPAVAYYSITTTDLKVLRCNDPDCTAGGDTITSPDTAGDVGYQPSIRLDGAGNPVVSYTERTSPARIKLLHCNDSSCSGNDDSIETVDLPGSAGAVSSLDLDASGNPVISYPRYQGGTTRMINVAHCNDSDCAGGDESIETIVVLQAYTSLLGFTSLALDAAGYPVVAYSSDNLTNYDVSVAHCNDANCAGGDESVVGLDEALWNPVVAIASSGDPVVAYHSLSGGMKVTRCANPNCAASTATTGAGNNVTAALGSDVEVTFANVSIAGATTLSIANGVLPGLNVAGPYYTISTTATHSGTATVCIDYDGSSYTALEEASLRMGHYERTTVWADITTSLDTVSDRICGQTQRLSQFTFLPLVPGDDVDADGCPSDKELATTQLSGGKRNPFNPWDYFNPSGDGLNRVDDILLVLDQYYIDDADPSGGRPPYQTGYTPSTDRSLLGPDQWDLGRPDAMQRIDDILYTVQQYFHDCS